MQQESTQAKGPEGNALMPQSQEKCCVGKNSHNPTGFFFLLIITTYLCGAFLE